MAKLRQGLHLDPREYKKMTDIINHLEDFGVDARQVIENTAQATVKKMKREAPKDTHRLERNITAQYTIDGTVQIESEAIDPETGVDYAYIQEYGLSRFKTTPYFRKNIQYFIRKVERDLRGLFRTYTSLGAGYRTRQLRRRR